MAEFPPHNGMGVSRGSPRGHPELPALRGHRRTACTGPSIQHTPRLLLAQMRGSLLWETFGVSGGGSCPPASPWHPVPCPPLLLCCSDTAIKWIGVDPAARPSPCVRSPHCGRTSSLVICRGGDLWGEGGWSQVWGRADGFSWWWDLATSRVGFKGEDPTDGSRGVAGTPTMGRGLPPVSVREVLGGTGDMGGPMGTKEAKLDLALSQTSSPSSRSAW